MNTQEQLKLVLHIVSYNLKIVFGNKFIYFLIAAWLFFLTIIGIMLFSDGQAETSDIYDLLILPGILMMFYPIVYNKAIKIPACLRSFSESRIIVIKYTLSALQ